MRFLFLLLLFFSLTDLHAQVLSPREQARVVDEILADRINHLLPGLMDRAGIDMWVIISREYNEDPVIKTFLPATWLSARRRTILVFYRDAKKGLFEKLAVARYNVGTAIQSAWNPEKQPDQWKALVDIITSRNPQKIGLNFSADFGHADGLTHTEYTELLQHLPAAEKRKITSAEKLAVSWLETRTSREMQVYPSLVQLTHSLIAEAFSEKVITPGITTTDDVVWWFRQRFAQLGLATWFHPSVDVQRSDSLSAEHLRSFAARPADQVIQPGDLLHCDVGITYLRLNTDVQQHAYVLRPGETAVPASIGAAMTAARRLQDFLTGQFRNGATGNQLLAGALQEAKAAGIRPSIYTHPLGLHGHAAGPTIGLWDQQGGVPGPGDYPLYSNTAYSIELNATTYIPEWKKDARIMLEEDGFWDGKTFRYISGRQKNIYTIPRLTTAISE
ncbi:aminopeptidase P family protein [Flavisolibacter sp. BT320]|nr:aminopeptidase P family protein [Flavisolibacter longurius]